MVSGNTFLYLLLHQIHSPGLGDSCEYRLWSLQTPISLLVHPVHGPRKHLPTYCDIKYIALGLKKIVVDIGSGPWKHLLTYCASSKWSPETPSYLLCHQIHSPGPEDSCGYRLWSLETPLLRDLPPLQKRRSPFVKSMLYDRIQ
jgi:hypothetical protein